MTPYELRFEIFKQSYNMLNNEFSVEYDTVRCWNDNDKNTVKMDYPTFPSLGEVLELADIINTFVSDAK